MLTRPRDSGSHETVSTLDWQELIRPRPYDSSLSLSHRHSSDSCNITKPPPASADETAVSCCTCFRKAAQARHQVFATLERIRLIVGQNLSQLSKVLTFVQLLHVTGITWFAWLRLDWRELLQAGSCYWEGFRFAGLLDRGRREAVSAGVPAARGCSI